MVSFNNFSNFNPINRLLAERTEAARTSKVKLADDHGALAPHREVARSLSIASHPHARVIAESSLSDSPTLYPTNGSARGYSRMLDAAASRHLAG